MSHLQLETKLEITGRLLFLGRILKIKIGFKNFHYSVNNVSEIREIRNGVLRRISVRQLNEYDISKYNNKIYKVTLSEISFCNYPKGIKRKKILYDVFIHI